MEPRSDPPSAPAANSLPESSDRPASHQPLILVTGASGNIGRWTVRELLERGFRVRALTSKAPDGLDTQGGRIEWRQMDFQTSLDFRPHVQDCAGVIHLAAEIVRSELMERVNVDATRSLARAAQAAGIKVFIYTSSVAVYGSGLTRRISEDSPVLTTSADVRSEYWAEPGLRAYGRTKLLGEQALREEISTVEAIILRPTVVVDVPQLVDVARMSSVKKMLTAYRHAHHVNVRDVADVILFFLQRGLDRNRPRPGAEIYNVSEDEFPDNSFADFFSKLHAATGDPAFKVMTMPRHLDWLRDVLKFRTLPFRYSLGRMTFPADRLHQEGFRVRHGMASLHQLALAEIARKE